jgi:hypothetical protein
VYPLTPRTVRRMEIKRRGRESDGIVALLHHLRILRHILHLNGVAVVQGLFHLTERGEDLVKRGPGPDQENQR